MRLKCNFFNFVFYECVCVCVCFSIQIRGRGKQGLQMRVIATPNTNRIKK